MRATVLFAATALVLASCGGGGTATPTVRTDVPVTDGANASDPLDTAAPATMAPDAAGDLRVASSGFSTALQYGSTMITAAAELVNDGDGYVGMISWTAELVDAAGVVIDHSSDTFYGALAPGESMWAVPNFFGIEGTQPAALNVTVESADRLTDLAVVDGTMPLGDISVVMAVGRTVFDINDVMHIEAEFRNDSDARLTQLSVSCGVYSDGALAGGASGYLSEITPRGLAGFDSTSGLANITPAPTDVRCHASPGISSEYQPGVAGSELQVQAGFAYNPGGVAGTHDVNIGTTIFNPTQKAALWVTVDVDMLDAQGRFIQLASISEAYVLPGETVYTGAFPVPDTASDPPASLRTRVHVSEWGDPKNATLASDDSLDLTSYTFDVSGAQVYHENGMLMIGGTVTNRSAVGMDGLSVSCTAFAGGSIAAGGRWTLDPAPIGIGVPFEIITGYTGTISADEVKCTVHLTSIWEPIA